MPKLKSFSENTVPEKSNFIKGEFLTFGADRKFDREFFSIKAMDEVPMESSNSELAKKMYTKNRIACANGSFITVIKTASCGATELNNVTEKLSGRKLKIIKMPKLKSFSENAQKLRPTYEDEMSPFPPGMLERVNPLPRKLIIENTVPEKSNFIKERFLNANN